MPIALEKAMPRTRAEGTKDLNLDRRLSPKMLATVHVQVR